MIGTRNLPSSNAGKDTLLSCIHVGTVVGTKRGHFSLCFASSARADVTGITAGRQHD